MANIVGIRFRRAGHIEWCDAQDFDIALDEYLVVQTEKGVDLGRVVLVPGHNAVEPQQAPFPVIRRGTPEDLRKMAYHRSREGEALSRCRDKVARHGLPMKMLAAEYAFDGTRLTFHFCADGRVDFRELVRDLAGTFRTRIELRQVGPRDETKLRGGVARCGRELCCASWLKDFSPVSMRMAKNQDLPLTDSRLGGICGRLMCCLAYENSAYARLKEKSHQVECQSGGEDAAAACKICGAKPGEPGAALICPHFPAGAVSAG